MNILERIKLIRPQLNAELSPRRDVRYAGDALSGINPEGSWIEESLHNPFGSMPTFLEEYLNKKLTGVVTTNEMRANAAKRQAQRERPDYIGHGAYGTVYSQEPGLVRKEIEGESIKNVQEELDNQLFLAESGVGPRVDAYETDQRGDMQTIVMQDLRDNYEPLLKDGPIEIVDSWGSPGTQAKYRQFALDHQKQMGMLALKGMKLMDRHSSNVMRHTMTGRPMQLDAGIARRVTGGEQVETLVEATSEGFKASGQPDIAEIISDTAYDYLAGGQVQEAWDFTREAFANLQKIKKPLPESSIHYKGNRYADLGRIDEILSKAMKEANNFAQFVKPQATIPGVPSENLISL